MAPISRSFGLYSARAWLEILSILMKVQKGFWVSGLGFRVLGGFGVLGFGGFRV